MLESCIKFTVKILTSIIFNKKLRKSYREKFLTKYYGYNVLKNAKFVGKNFYCGGFSSVNNNTSIGNDVCFNGLNIHGNGEVTIGNYFHSGVECLIITQNHNYEGNKLPYDETYYCKKVEINNCVWLGSRVTILPGTEIGEGAIIQAGAVVHGTIPAYSIAGGNPAKVFKYRNIEHYNKLKAKKNFLKNYDI